MSDRFGNIPIEPASGQTSKAEPVKRRVRKTSKPPRRKPSHAGSSRSAIWLAIPLVLLFLYTVAGLYGVPYYFQTVLPKTLFTETGFHLKTSKVSFNPYTFQLQVSDSHFRSLKGEEIFSITSLTAKLAPISLLRNELVCKSLLINGVTADLVRNNDGSYNFSALFGEADTQQSDIMDFSDLPFLFSFNNIKIRESMVRFSDMPTGKNHLIESISLDLPTFSNFQYASDQLLQPHFSAIINGSPVELAGEAPLGPAGGEHQASTLKCNLRNLDLSAYVGYLPFTLPVEFRRGQANGTLEFKFAPEGSKTDRLTVHFSLQLAVVQVQASDPDCVLEIPEASIVGAIRPASRDIHFSNITVKNPRLVLARKTRLGDSIRTLLPVSFPVYDAAASSSLVFNSIVDLLIIDNGTILRQNNNAKTSYRIWQNCSLSIKDYSYDAQPSSAATPRVASFSVNAENPDNDGFLTWQGNFTDGSHALGALQLVKFPVEDLWPFINDSKIEKLKGLADLSGTFGLYLGKAIDNRSIFTLHDSIIKISDFSLLKKKSSYLSGPLVEIGPVSINESSMSLGKVVMKRGTATIDLSAPPPFIKRLTTPQLTMTGVDFQGTAVISNSRSDATLLSLADLSFKADFTQKPKEGENNFSILAKSNNGGILKGQGSLSLSPFDCNSRIGFADFSLVNVLHLFTGTQPADGITGKMSGKGTILLPQRSYAGELLVSDVYIDEDSPTASTCQKALLQNVSYSAKPSHFGIAKVDIADCDINLPVTSTDPDPVARLSGFLRNLLGLKEKSSQPKQKIELSATDIQEVTFSDVSIALLDERYSPTLELHANGINGSIVGLHSVSSAEKSSFNVTGPPQDGNLEISGEASFLAEKPVGKYRLTAQNIPLGTFAQHLDPTLQLDPNQGMIDLVFNMQLQDDMKQANLDLQVSGARTLSSNSPSSLALALLTGQNDSFQMSVSENSSRGSSSKKLIEEASAQFQTLVVKSSLSPLLLASGDFTDLIGHEFAEFVPGEAMLTNAGRDILTRYTTLLLSHPHIGLALSGGIDLEVDHQALRAQLQAANQKKIDEENQKNKKAWEEEQNKYQAQLFRRQSNNNLNATIVETDIPPELLQEFIPKKAEPVTINDDMLLDLAKRRLKVLKDYFTSQAIADANRIITADPQSLSDIDQPSRNGINITLIVVKP